MGITIYFEGKLRSEEAFNDLMLFTSNYAEENDLPYQLFKNQKNILFKVKDGEVAEDNFLVKGILFRPNPKSDTLLLEFDEDLHTYTFCKTQFAGDETHIALIEFFKKIEPFFDEFKLTDEGEYWETGDKDLLQEKFDLIDKMMKQIEKELEDYKKNNAWRYN